MSAPARSALDVVSAAAPLHQPSRADVDARFEPATRTPSARPKTAPDLPAALRSYDTLCSTLGDEAARANIAYVLSGLANKGGKAGAAAAAILAEGSWRFTRLPRTRDDVADVVAMLVGRRTDGEIEKQVRANVAKDTSARGKVRHFAVVPVTPTPAPPSTLGIEPERGFTQGVDKLPLDEEHSIKNVQSYIDERWGRFVLHDVVDHHRTVEIHHGAREQGFASLSERGFDRLHRVHTPEALTQNELYLAQSSTTGEIRYAMTEVWGRDRLAHVQKLLHAAVVEGEAGPRRVQGAQIEVFAEPLRRPEEIYRRYSRALLKSGGAPADVVLGFKNGILLELGKRTAQARRLEHVQRTLGGDPATTLRQRADDAGPAGLPLRQLLDQLGDDLKVLQEPPVEIFKFAVKLEQLQVVERAFAGLRAHPEALALVADVVGPGGFKIEVAGQVREAIPTDSFVDQSVITFVDDAGAKRSLLLSRNPYGDLAHEMGQVLVDNGVKNIFVFGTAGALAPGAQIGDLHVPDKFLASGGAEPFRNVAVSVVSAMPERLRPPVQLGSTLANVTSPLDETMPAIERLRQRGANVVEMELSHLLDALKGQGADVAAVYLVSDIPGTEKTIEKQAKNELARALSSAVDLLVQSLGMRGVVLVHDETPPPLSSWEGCQLLAGRVLKSRGVEGPGHDLMELVLGRYLLNGLGDEAIQALVRDEKADPLTSKSLSSRWQEKAVREAQKAYSNDDVVEHLRDLGRQLADAVREVQRAGGKPGEYRLHVLGSIVKGRVGIGSDVDTLLETKDPALATRVYQSPYGYLGGKPGRDVVIGSHEYAMRRGEFFGPVLDLGDGSAVLADPDHLVKVYARAAASSGLHIAQDPAGKWCVSKSDVDRASVPQREIPAAAERILEHEKTFRRAVSTDFLVRHLKNLQPLADVAHLPLERLVATGEATIRSRLVDAFTPARLSELLSQPLGAQKLASPRGQLFLAAAGLQDGAALLERLSTKGIAGLPLSTLFDGELASALMRVGDPLDELAVDLACAARAQRQHAGGPPQQMPAFFDRELLQAERRDRLPRGGSPVLTQARASARAIKP